MNNFIEILASALECCIFVRICNGYLGFKNEKLKWLKTIIVYIPTALVDVFLSQIDGVENVSVFMILLFLLVYSFVFLSGKIWEKILVSVIPTLTALPINLIVMSVFAMLADNNREEVMPGGIMRIPVLFFSKAIFFFACEIVIRIKKKQYRSLSGFQWFLQLACFLISFLISTLLWNISREQQETSPLFLMIFLLIGAMNQLPEWVYYNSRAMILVGGNPRGKFVGEYSAEFQLKNGYAWSGGSKENAVVSWHIQDSPDSVTMTKDKIFLLSEYECIGRNVSSNHAEDNYQEQYEYYRLNGFKGKSKYNNPDENVESWLRSPSHSSDSAFCSVFYSPNTPSGGYAGNFASSSLGFAPCFAVGGTDSSGTGGDYDPDNPEPIKPINGVTRIHIPQQIKFNHTGGTHYDSDKRHKTKTRQRAYKRQQFRFRNYSGGNVFVHNKSGGNKRHRHKTAYQFRGARTRRLAPYDNCGNVFLPRQALWNGAL